MRVAGNLWMASAALGSAAVLALIGGCSDVESLNIEIDGVAYAIPTEHVVRSILPGQGQLYVVARPSGSSFQLVYTETHKYSRNFQGGDTPLVPEINDATARAFEEYDFASGKTVCRVGPRHWNCGLRLEDGGVVWSVVFDRDQVPNSEALRNAASSLLAAYRRQE